MMMKQKIAAAATAMVLVTTSLGAFAQPGPRGPQHQHGAGSPHQMHPHTPQPHAHGKVPMAKPHHPAHARGTPPGHVKRMGAGPQHNWVKGTRMPKQYRMPQYVVNDWKRHGLKQPPRGQQWVQYGGDYLLVAIATGVITQLILGH